MDKYYFYTIFIIFFSVITLCGCSKYEYSGQINLSGYDFLKGKKIFIDPGHGGIKGDVFRTGPTGLTEQEVNLNVSMILREMLTTAGAEIFMSRDSDKDISLDQRVAMVEKIKPDLLISIHHNGSARRADGVNYPAVLIWGNSQVRPLSFAFAELLLDEFERFMEIKGHVISDFAIYSETGTRILRETRYVCPGVIGECGFFSDTANEIQLKDIHYNQREAEAYFYAIAEFFKRGVPEAEVLISCQPETYGHLKGMIKDNKPLIAIKTYSGIESSPIDKKSLDVRLDNIKIKARQAADDLFIIDYGKELYPGGHTIRFSFKNKRNQASMIYRTGITVEIKKGDYDNLVKKGISNIRRSSTATEGLKMLMAALSMSSSDPDAPMIISNIAAGFSLIGDKGNSQYFNAMLYHFYPQSRYSRNLKSKFPDYRYPVEYKGKWIDIKFEPSLKVDVTK